MKFFIFCLYFIFISGVWRAQCELSQDAVNSLLKLYTNSLNSSISLSRSDRDLLHSWDEEFQIKRVNVTSKIRTQIAKHKEHSFKKKNSDRKWIKCIDVYEIEIDNTEIQYFKGETACLRNCNAEDFDKRQAVDQVEREIKKWRRSYKYLIHLCNINNPGDEVNTASCLVEYMEKDNYNSTIQRLMVMKLEVMGQLYTQLTSSITHLETCLNSTLSSYLEAVRSLMEILGRCYNGTKKD